MMTRRGRGPTRVDRSPGAAVSQSPAGKARTKHTDEGMPVHSFQTLLQDLATVTKNLIRFSQSPMETTSMLAKPTPLQQRAFDLLQVPLKL
jgi:hypothetical protein